MTWMRVWEVGRRTQGRALLFSEIPNSNHVTFDHNLCTVIFLSYPGFTLQVLQACSPNCCGKIFVCGHNLCAAKICVQPRFVWCQRFAIAHARCNFFLLDAFATRLRDPTREDAKANSQRERGKREILVSGVGRFGG